METKNNYTLITGGSQGIGLSLAGQFARNGYNLILVARDPSELEEASAALAPYGVAIITMVKDLFNKDAAHELYNEIADRGLEVDILVNNAGQGQYGLFEDTEIGRELAIIQLNVCSLVILTKFFLKDMLQRGKGKILNVSSIAGKTPGPWQAVYHGTKAFVQSFTQAIRSEVKDNGITVTALLPGATDTDFFNKAGMTGSKAVEDSDKLADPEEVAKDGYNALMEGKDQVISGFRNKMNVVMSNIMPDSAAADNMKDTQEPVDR